MKTSNNIPIIEHEDIINIFTENLRAKRKEKGHTRAVSRYTWRNSQNI